MKRNTQNQENVPVSYTPLAYCTLPYHHVSVSLTYPVQAMLVVSFGVVNG